MKLEALSVSKYRTAGLVGDDVPLVVPGAVLGVFDGATDPRGTRVDGMGAGRLAALTVAGAVAELAAEPALDDMSGADILARLSERLAHRTAPLNLPIPPSTTMAVAFDRGTHWRFVAVGDSGIRLNGSELMRREKPIDDVSVLARVAVFRHLAGDQAPTDATEAAARRAILLGLDRAVEEGVLSAGTMRDIIGATVRRLGFERQRESVERFLRGGIETQHAFGNDPDSELGFDTLNGTLPRRGELLDLTRDKAGVRSIEIFTDGYSRIPREASVAAWEACFAEVEAEDFHRIGAHASVKGSTSAEFFDDRTVIVAGGL